ncbi:MAG: alkaline phosphatase family protein [Gemmatimonadaceae bacterium]|nr:alkaline phosphatase family protein [Gemmatimonadaceae bacterium]
MTDSSLSPRVLLAAFALATITPAASIAQTRTRNVVLIVSDGLRWQEVFRGAERALVSRTAGGVRDTTAALRRWYREDLASRRRTLLPFLWGRIANDGVLLGNQDSGSVAAITNTMRFSYPGYNELLTGAADPRIDSNEYPPNPNITVFEWLARRPAYRGKVAAIATWDAFRRIFNRERAGFDVFDGWDEPFHGAMARTPRAAFVNEWYRTSVRMWDGNAFDAPMHAATKEYIRQRKPRVLFVGYGETDEWAHSGMYDMLLQSAHRVDGYIRDLWETMQAMPEYRGTTTFIITTDHGRGDGPSKWRDHGEDVTGAENIWLAVIGPDTPALGEVTRAARVAQSQVAATLAALLGEDWRATNPQAGAPITSVVGRRR